MHFSSVFQFFNFRRAKFLGGSAAGRWRDRDGRVVATFVSHRDAYRIRARSAAGCSDRVDGRGSDRCNEELARSLSRGCLLKRSTASDSARPAELPFVAREASTARSGAAAGCGLRCTDRCPRRVRLRARGRATSAVAERTRVAPAPSAFARRSRGTSTRPTRGARDSLARDRPRVITIDISARKPQNVGRIDRGPYPIARRRARAHPPPPPPRTA